MKACISLPKDNTKKIPAMIWITGGFPVGGIGDYVWKPSKVSNDQSAQSYRHLGMVMMYPTFRGDFGNPGQIEGYYGEINDVISAHSYLSKLDYIDKNRIYSGGHSSGGTLALLVAESTDIFRGVIAFGPSCDPIERYPSTHFFHDLSDKKENALRTPSKYLKSIETPTLIIEGSESVDYTDNIGLFNKSKNVKIFYPEAADHFNILFPINRMIANDLSKNPDALSTYTYERINKEYSTFSKQQTDADDLRTLAYLRTQGTDFAKPVTVTHYYYTDWKDDAQALVKSVKESAFSEAKITDKKDQNGDPYYVIKLTKNLDLSKMANVFKTRAEAEKLRSEHDLNYEGWSVE